MTLREAHASVPQFNQMSDMLQLVVTCHTFNVFQKLRLSMIEPCEELHGFLKEVESVAPHDKLKHIGHLVELWQPAW
jgi:hypothetical protein